MTSTSQHANIIAETRRKETNGQNRRRAEVEPAMHHKTKKNSQDKRRNNSQDKRRTHKTKEGTTHKTKEELTRQKKEQLTRQKRRRKNSLMGVER